MTKSISVWAFRPDRPLSEVFALARDHGFAAVEVAVAETGELNLHSTPDDCARIREQAEQAGVSLSSLASGLGWRYPMTAVDDALARKGREATAQSLRIAGWLGVDALLVVPGGVGADFIESFPATPYDTAYDNALRALGELKSVAEETRVHLGVENVWNRFLLSPLELRDFLDKVGSPYVGSYFDVGNVVVTGHPEQWIRILGQRIVRVHFKDFKRAVGTLDGFCGLLDGDVDYAAVMNALRDIGYDGFVTSEFFNCEADLPKISQAMDKILAM